MTQRGDSRAEAAAAGQCGCVQGYKHGSSELTASRFAVIFPAGLSGGSGGELASSLPFLA
jgi:hypothetical protein